ncbi:MAG: hypothetical protein ACI4MK_06160, partial [Aristaeellaceae bacterium]
MEQRLSRFLPRRNYVLYNLLLVLIPIVLMTTLFYGIMKRHVTDEIIRMYTVELEQKQRMIDERMQNFGSMMAYASLDQDLTPFHLKQNSYETVTALQHMRQLASAQGDSLVYFYIHSDDTLYSPIGKWSRKTFEKQYQFEGDWTMDDFMQMLEEPEPYESSPLDCSLRSTSGNPCSYVVIVFPWTSRSVLYGTGVCLIPREWLEQQLIISSSHPVYCVDTMDNAFGQAGNAGEDFLSHALDSAGNAVHINGQLWHLVWCQSDILNWRYVIGISDREISAMMQGEKPWMYPAALLLVLLCVFLGIMVALRYYWPVEHLGKLLGKDNADARQVHDYVQDMVQHNEQMKTQNLDMRLSLEETQDTLAQEMLAKILWRDADEDTCRLWQKRGHIPLEEGCMQVMAADMRAVSSAVLEDVLAFFHDEQICATEAPHTGYVAIVFSHRKQDPVTLRESAEALAGRLVRAIMEHFGVQPRIGIGLPCEKLSELGKSYIEAIAALKDTEPRHVHCFADTLQAQSSIVDKRIAIQTFHLMEALHQANSEEAAEACDELERKLHEIYWKTDAVIFRFTINSVLKDILPCFERADLDNLMWKVNLAMHASKPDTFMRHLRMLCQQSIQRMTYKKNAQKNKQMEDILAYVNAHFADQNLSQAGVAEIF